MMDTGRPPRHHGWAHRLPLPDDSAPGATAAAAERPVHDLGDLAPDGVVVLAEVGPPLPVTGLPGPPTAIATDDPPTGRRFDHGVEGTTGRHIGKCGVGWGNRPP